MGHTVLVVGKGGREHAVCWKLAQSHVIDTLICAPGNPGIAQVAECAPVNVDDFTGLLALAKERNVDLVIVGPEDPLAAGLADIFTAEDILVAGPSAAAAQLEASKSFANDVMAAAGVPTARSVSVTSIEAGVAAIRELVNQHGVVVKADGLAAGKGVVVADDAESAIQALRTMATSSETIVIEERLVGAEISVLCLCDGKTIYPLQASCDYKRAFENDLGPNTGGMGNYTPSRLVDDHLMTRIETEILQPTIAEMANRDTPMKGILFAGLMLTDDGPKVIEFNCRFGDPEAQVVLPSMTDDLGVLLHAIATGTLAEHPRPQFSGAAVGVVLASDGYPGSYQTGKPIHGLDESHNAIVFHAGTRDEGGKIVTDGGRVLCVVGQADDLRTAQAKAYDVAHKISFEGSWMRNDIATRES